MKFKLAGFCIALLLLLTGSAFAQWQLEYQIELGYSFMAVHFPSANIGYTVGTNGVIYKTIDGGLTWVQQISPTGNTLNDVVFTDDTHGWAVGAAATIIYTTDGSTWSLVTPAFMPWAFNGVAAIGTNVWVAGGKDNNKCKIFYTANSGATWDTVTVANNPSNDMCTDISFSDATHGFAACDGGNSVADMSIMYTTDGGVTWTTSTDVDYGSFPGYGRFDIEAIRGISNSTVIATGWGSYTALTPTVLLVSTDGGVHFAPADSFYSWKTYCYGYNITVFDDGEAVIVGGGTQMTGVTIHGTGPGYTTWTRYPAFYGETIQDACAIPGTNNIVAVGDAGLIARSSDRGTTWSFLYDGGMPFQGLQDFVSLGKDKVLAAGAGGAMLNFDLAAGTVKYGMASPNCWGPTTVGDLDWVPNPDLQPQGVLDDTLYNDVIYLSGATKYFCKSYDGGKTWRELAHTSALQDGILSMYWFHPDTGIVVGHKAFGTRRDEVIWKTTNGGWTLTEVLAATLPPTDMQWNGIDFAPANRNIGVVVGDDNYIFYTTDGGTTWTQATENIATATIDLEDVVMVNSTTGFAVGDSGTLVKTTNGGAAWTVQAVTWGTVNLLDIEFNTPNRLWVGGVDNGFLWYSTNGGANWTNASVGLVTGTTDVKSVFFHGMSGILWAGCENSYVASRTDNVAGTDTPSLPFALNQNYPNPFNPSTTIEFAIASDDHVSLNVYNVSGKLVATIMNKDLKAGTYTVAFKADNLATGVYFYKLTTSTFEETRKMVLIR
jgi:photosystem II stability/assembly factor-like uncharacterized protein